jgi:predicted phosphodiesterase
MLKLAILADIHANFPALEAVLEDIQSWGPDRVIAAGDIINRGPRPMDCLELIDDKVQSDGWTILRGNHEEYVLYHEQPDASKNGPEFEVHLASFWTYKKLTAAMPMLHNLPLTYSLPDPNGEEVRITHASMGGIRDGIYPSMSDEKLRCKIGDPPVLFCVGHTHIPLVRRLEGTLVVNVGSAGLPFDSDTRPSYAQLTWRCGIWEAEIVRIQYDFQQAEDDFFTSGYLEEAGPLAFLVLLELRQARSYLYQWAHYYQQQVLAGDISMEQSVKDYLVHHP